MRHLLRKRCWFYQCSRSSTIAFDTGDLFEKKEDIANPKQWEEAGSEDPGKQKKNRLKVAQMADWIVPGHGPMFQVMEQHVDLLKQNVSLP